MLKLIMNGQITRSPHTYENQSIASSKIWDLNLYLYNKHSKHDRVIINMVKIGPNLNNKIY